MRSYILAVAVSMLLSAVYAFQNTSDIAVRFLMFQRDFPQGIWEVIVFSIGAVLMWFFSILASWEIHSGNAKQVKELKGKIAELEDEKKSLLAAFQRVAPTGDEPSDGSQVLPLREYATALQEHTASGDAENGSASI